MKVIRRITSWFILVIVFLLLFALTFLTIAEYRPKEEETLELQNTVTDQVNFSETLTIMTFNIGYASLGKDEDFVMDGGTKGRTDSKEVVENYLQGITSLLIDNPAEIYLLQEVDIHSRRSYYIDQREHLEASLGSAFVHHFAYNFKSIFVPFPVSKDYIGYVESGLLTMSNKKIEEASRFQFPGSFSWPLRVANLKRAMSVSRMQIADSLKELVVVNLHMSAYDQGGTMRDQEMQFLKEFLLTEQEAGNFVIVGGDFNQTFPEAQDIYPVLDDAYYVAYPIEPDFLPSGYDFHIDLTNPTCRLLNTPYDKNDPMTQYYIIDGFIVSDNITVEAVQTIAHDFYYSDHNPVVISFKLNP